jgi:D-alanyl-lipoteichoic acid acyltransferase DltB (MBOAT superfamily)
MLGKFFTPNINAMNESTSLTPQQISRLSIIISTSLAKKDWLLHFLTLYFDPNQNQCYKAEATLISPDNKFLIVYSINADGAYVHAIIKNFGV